MPDYKPLTKEERTEIDECIAKMFRAHYGTMTLNGLALYVCRYKATVVALETDSARQQKTISEFHFENGRLLKEVDALEAENGRLRELAEGGRVVEGIPNGWRLCRNYVADGADDGFYVIDDRNRLRGYGLTALAALQAAEGATHESD